VWLVACPAFGQAPGTVLLEELSWTELRDLIKAGKTTVIIPTGGVEQNGPHMALGKHDVRVKALSEKIARALDDTLVAPVVAYVPEGAVSPPTGHMRFPGTITVPDGIFQGVLESSARSLGRHGFRNIVFLGDHGSTRSGQKAVAARLTREWAGTGVRVHAVDEYYQASAVEFAQLLRARGFLDGAADGHAGLADTSLMLAIDARLVRPERLRPGTGPHGDGVVGDPSRASAELGQLGVELIVKRTVEAIRRAIAQP